MKTLLLNLPHSTRIQRRYMCSSYAPNYLFPPIELISLGGIIKSWKNLEVTLLDAIAEKYTEEQVCQFIKKYNPAIIVTISGFETVEDDMNCIRTLKNNFPSSKIILFGHYPTEFPEELLIASQADFILRGEPDLIFSKLLDELISGKSDFSIEGVCYWKNGEIQIQEKTRRIPDPNSLPIPAFELLNPRHYSEFLMPNPFGLIQTERGCPYQCNYCVKSYGSKLTALTPEKVLEQILHLKKLFGIKSLRFIDDTFTVIPERVMKICQLLIENDADINWSCLSRVDTINEELLIVMKKAGCKRIYFGVETASEKMATLFNKQFDREEAIKNLRLCRKIGIEAAGFFLMGHPEENDQDIDQTIQFAIKSELSYAVVGQLTPYPGTALFNSLKPYLDFSIFPYRNSFLDKTIETNYNKNEAKFYRAFYFNHSYILRKLPSFFGEFLNHLKLINNLFINNLKVRGFGKYPRFNSINRASK